jgi:dolichyl-diphosphooligosaccharide--protein glycosyltransferase
MIDKMEALKSKNRTGLYTGLILLIIFGTALAIRVFPLQETVFGSGWVNFQGVDSWYHIRLIENLLQHFPQRITFDPYTFYPYGQEVFFAPFFDWMIAFTAWVAGLGSPDQYTIKTVAAYFPPVLGALVTLPAFFIGKTLFDNRVGIISALIIGILPGHFLTVSRLGFVDHHVAEILFSTITIMFLLLAIKAAKEYSISFECIKNKKWKLLRRPLIYALLSGVALGVYLLIWVGGVLIVFLFFCWAIVMFIIHHLKNENSDYLSILGTPIFLIALLMILPFSKQLAYGDINLLALIICIVSLPALSIISKIMANISEKRSYYPLAILGLGIICLGGLYLIDSSIVISMLQKFQVFTPGNNALTISEVQPLFFDQGQFTLSRIWSLFTSASILAPIAFIWMLITTIKNKFSAEMVFLIIWCIIMFAATMGQVRFAAYLAINFALLSGYLLMKILNWVPGIMKWFEMKAPKEERDKRNKSKKNKTQPKRRYPAFYRLVYIALALALIFFLGVFPNIPPTKAIASADTGINRDLYDALVWMRDNTPDPFENSDYYNSTYLRASEEGGYKYPESAYGVMNWWPYGHWITEIAHRPPISNPHQYGAGNAARFFTAPDEDSANTIMDRLDARYVMIDFDIAVPFNSNLIQRRFPSVATWAEKPLSQFCELYYQKKDGILQPIILYYPAYYQCLSARLYNFGANEVTPENSTIVISYNIDSGQKIIQSAQTFRTYEEGISFLDKQTASNYEMVGISPFASPVHIEKLEHYREVYSSEATLTIDEKSSIPLIRIFQYLP